jgi:DNA helicase-2/ATP-dependent DNA helicase PcrA
MQGADPDLLAIERGCVTAPAGCGKTHLIAEALGRHSGKPILVLTHTNSGVAALRGRLDAAGVPAVKYRLFTLDGWAMRLVATFPARSGLDPFVLKLATPSSDYPKIRLAALQLLKADHISDLLKANYSRVIVDEYQDCSMHQHGIVGYAARTLPTCVLGDPLQAIFGFGGTELARWTDQVCRYFPVAGELSTPWRWINANAEPLGVWLLDVRKKLLAREPIDLRDAPEGVVWVELDGTEDYERCLKAAQMSGVGVGGPVLILVDSKNPPRQRQVAGHTPGAVVVEAVDLRDLVAFGRAFELASPDALELLLGFAQSVMTNVGADDLIRRVATLNAGRARKAATGAEVAALLFAEAPSYARAADVLAEIGKQGGVRVYRPALLRTCRQALQLCDRAGGPSLYEATIQMREQNRLAGRSLPKRAVGSTLLMKGLEGDVAVVFDAHELDANHLYVSMTRGARRLVVCSRTPTLNPRQ